MNKDYLIYKLSETVKETSRIENDLFKCFGVKRGLRNEDHSGVLVGLTNIGDVVGYERIQGADGKGVLKAIPGKLLYRGIEVSDLVHGVQAENRLGSEETAFLLLSG
ncbi:MAG: citrate synthase, partial [Rikenella sp.]|nr:citrate synthase [Rikenella sp.]